MIQLTFGDEAISQHVKGDMSFLQVLGVTKYFPAAFPIVQTAHVESRQEYLDCNSGEHEVTVTKEDSLTWRE